MSNPVIAESAQDFRSVHNWWTDNVCGTQITDEERLSREYFEAIETHRYGQEPFIFSFAQFTRFHGQRILEVGVGAGTDFLQWVRAGARATGIDLTEAAIEHVQRRLELYGLKAEELRIANAESLDFTDDTFDLVYSWGVIHHSPSIENALREIVRVTKPGGRCKLMLYHRHSLCACYIWLKWALLRGKPFRSVSTCLARHVESPGTKAVTTGEVRALLHRLGIGEMVIAPVLTYHDRLEGYPLLRPFGRALARIAGSRAGWFMLVDFRKPLAR